MKYLRELSLIFLTALLLSLPAGYENDHFAKVLFAIAFINSLHVFVPFVFHYNSIKDPLWQELYELSEDIFSGVHRMTDLLLDCKGSQFKSSPSILRSKTLYLNNLQSFPLFF